MGKKIEIEVDEVVRVYKLLEEVNDLFHQQLKYKDVAVTSEFAKKNYVEIKDLYYNVVWDWLPQSIRDEIIDE